MIASCFSFERNTFLQGEESLAHIKICEGSALVRVIARVKQKGLAKSYQGIHVYMDYCYIFRKVDTPSRSARDERRRATHNEGIEIIILNLLYSGILNSF